MDTDLVGYWDRRRLTYCHHFPERIEVDGPEEILEENQPRPFFADDKIDVFIIAAMVNPEGNERKNEWISIINLSSDSVDLGEWTLLDAKQRSLKLHDINLAPGQATAIKNISPLALSNKGGNITLFNKKEERVDRVKYTKIEAQKQGIPIAFTYRMK